MVSSLRFDAPRFALCGIFALVLGFFFGNVLIAIGHVLLIVALIQCWRQKEPKNSVSRSPRFSSAWFLCAFLIFAALSVFLNWSTIEEPLDHLKKLRHYLLPLLLLLTYPIWLEEFRAGKKRSLLFWAWAFGLTVAILFGLIGFIWDVYPLRGGPPKDEGRLAGLYGQVMTFAYGLQFSTLAGLILVVRKEMARSVAPTVPYLLFAAVLLLAVVGLYLTHTRGALLGFFFGAVVFSALASRKLFIGIAAASVLLVIVASVNDSRLLDLKHGSIRMSHWRAAAVTFAAHPLDGVGFRNFELRSAELKKKFSLPPDVVKERKKSRQELYLDRHAHNNYLEAFASTGLFGGLAFLLFCGAWWMECWRSPRYRAILVPLITAFLVSGMFETTFFDSEVLTTILVLYLFSQILLREEKAGLADSA